MLHDRKDYNRRIQDSENIIPEDEPVFLLRAQDVNALQTLQEYTLMIAKFPNHDPLFLKSLERQVGRFINWRKHNTNSVHHPTVKPEDVT